MDMIDKFRELIKTSKETRAESMVSIFAIDQDILGNDEEESLDGIPFYQRCSEEAGYLIDSYKDIGKKEFRGIAQAIQSDIMEMTPVSHTDLLKIFNCKSANTPAKLIRTLSNQETKTLWVESLEAVKDICDDRIAKSKVPAPAAKLA